MILALSCSYFSNTGNEDMDFKITRLLKTIFSCLCIKLNKKKIIIKKRRSYLQEIVEDFLLQIHLSCHYSSAVPQSGFHTALFPKSSFSKFSTYWFPLPGNCPTHQKWSD